MNIEEQLLTASIRNTIRDADRAVSKYFYICENPTIGEGDTDAQIEYDEDVIEARELIEFQVEKVFRDTALLAERLGLPAFRRDIVRAMATFSNLAETTMTRWDVEFHCPALSRARSLFNSLAILTEGREVTGLGVFETILGNTGKFIDRSHLEPANEAQVRSAVREILEFSFGDVVREIPIPKSIKTYRPDIGVRSLMSAAEYKFIDSKEEAKNSLDGIYADMRGYSGSPEWRSFYAVFYMTAPFFTQKDVDNEFQLVKADLSWKPIVIVGPGGRSLKNVP